MEKIMDLGIIGYGPGGFTAAVYAARANIEYMVFEKGIIGGQVINTHAIENYPGFKNILGHELSDAFREQEEFLGIKKVRLNVKEISKEGNVFKVSTRKGDYLFKKIIISTGCIPNKLNVDGEIDFLGAGVSYCAVCDANFFAGQDVVVVGGGDSAIEEAIYLSNIVKSVTVVHRRDKLRAKYGLQERAFKTDNISFIWDSVVEEISGDDKVSNIKIKNIKTNEIITHNTNGIFIYVGMKPNSDAFANLGIANDNGFIDVDNRYMTKVEGIYAVGDILDVKHRQIVIAAGQGASAALNAYDSLHEE